MEKKKKIPHTFVIVFAIIVIAAISTWFAQGGEYGRTVKILPDGSSKNIIVPESYQSVPSQPQTWQIFSAFFEGFVARADIIVFILLIGGAFWIMNASKAIDVAIISFLKFSQRFEKIRVIRYLGVNNIIMTMIMIIFSLFGSVFGMSEETIAFIIIFVPLAIRMGYDSIVGVCLCFVAAGLGFAGATLNPFTIGIAQGLSDIPLFSGLEYRIVCWVVITLSGIVFILRYAARVKRNPEISPVYDDDIVWRNAAETGPEEVKYETPRSAWIVFVMLLAVMTVAACTLPMTSMNLGQTIVNFPVLPLLTVFFAITSIISLRKSVHFFILNIFLFTILYLIVGVMGYKWYVLEIATLFFGMGIASGLAMNYSANKITDLFICGVKDILSAALIVALAGGIIIILQKGKVIDSMLHGIAGSMDDVGKYGSLSIMYSIQTAINLIITSGSAKAALTMPIMAPFSDLIDVSRQATVMAYQFGDGFTNMITPTSAVLVGVLGVAKIPFEKWLKWVWPLILFLFVLGFLLLIPTVTMKLNGF
ncbi:MAG: AbgT family transporter [Bacteroidales bacterium]